MSTYAGKDWEYKHRWPSTESSCVSGNTKNAEKPPLPERTSPASQLWCLEFFCATLRLQYVPCKTVTPGWRAGEFLPALDSPYNLLTCCFLIGMSSFPKTQALDTLHTWPSSGTHCHPLRYLLVMETIFIQVTSDFSHSCVCRLHPSWNSLFPGMMWYYDVLILLSLMCVSLALDLFFIIPTRHSWPPPFVFL